MGDALLVSGGTLVDARHAREGDLLVRDGQIAAVGPAPLEGAGDARVLDARGLLVMPGGVDPHVHLAHPIDHQETADDFYTGTLAAAAGGVTTVLDFALPGPGEGLGRALERRRARAEVEAVVDFGFHAIVPEVTDAALSEVPDLVAGGQPSFKVYMTYPGLAVGDEPLLRLLSQTASHGGVVYLHCENDAAIRHLTRRLLASGHTEPVYHARSRPPQVEAEATGRAIVLAEIAGAPMCVAHVSSAEAVEAVARARERGVAVTAETCPHYLVLNEDRYRLSSEAEAALFVCSPPLRPTGHQNALWYGLHDGTLQMVVSDHAPFRPEQKTGARDFTGIPNGLPGLETRLPLLFSRAVSTGRMSPSRFVQLVSTHPARTFGLYPQKGSLDVGADADLVLFDPERETTLEAARLHSAAGYTPFQGTKVRGAPALTLSRGQEVARDGRAQAERGRGRWVSRAPVHAAALP